MTSGCSQPVNVMPFLSAYIFAYEVRPGGGLYFHFVSQSTRGSSTSGQDIPSHSQGRGTLPPLPPPPPPGQVFTLFPPSPARTGVPLPPLPALLPPPPPPSQDQGGCVARAVYLLRSHRKTFLFRMCRRFLYN